MSFLAPLIPVINGAFLFYRGPATCWRPVPCVAAPAAFGLVCYTSSATSLSFTAGTGLSPPRSWALPGGYKRFSCRPTLGSAHQPKQLFFFSCFYFTAKFYILLVPVLRASRPPIYRGLFERSFLAAPTVSFYCLSGQRLRCRWISPHHQSFLLQRLPRLVVRQKENPVSDRFFISIYLSLI